MPTSEPEDGTYQRPVHLPCPLHNRSWPSRNLMPHLDPTKWFTCTSHDHHGIRLWTTCRGGTQGTLPGWDDAAEHHTWSDAA